MNRKEIQLNLQTRVREYLSFIWNEEKRQNFDQENKIINSLSHTLKEELIFDAYGSFLKNNPVLSKYFSEETLKKLVFSMKEILVNPGDKIFTVDLFFFSK